MRSNIFLGLVALSFVVSGCGDDKKSEEAKPLFSVWVVRENKEAHIKKGSVKLDLSNARMNEDFLYTHTQDNTLVLTNNPERNHRRPMEEVRGRDFDSDNGNGNGGGGGSGNESGNYFRIEGNEDSGVILMEKNGKTRSYDYTKANGLLTVCTVASLRGNAESNCDQYE